MTNTAGKTEEHMNSNREGGEGGGSAGSGDKNMDIAVQPGVSEPGTKQTDASNDKTKPSKEDKKEQVEENKSDNLNQIVIEEISGNEEVRKNEKDGSKDENKLNQKKVEKERKEEKEKHKKEKATEK